MMIRREKRFNLLLLLILFTLSFSACAGVEANREDTVTTEYLLKQAGFWRMDVNMTTPKRQALLDATPPGKLVAVKMDGENYYVYADQAARILYLGNEAAYQNYLSKASGRKLCEVVEAKSGEQFWSCFQALQQPGQK